MRPLLPALALMLTTAAPLHAEVTAGRVWQNWQDTAQAWGVTLQARSVTPGTDGLTLGGLGAELDLGLLGRVRVSAPELRLQEEADGAVSVQAGAPLAISHHAAFDDAGADYALDIAIPRGQGRLRASGVPGGLRYDFTAPRLDWTGESRMSAMEAEEQATPLQSGAMTGSAEEITAHWLAAEGADAGTGTGGYEAARTSRVLLRTSSDGTEIARDTALSEDHSGSLAIEARDGRDLRLTGDIRRARLQTQGTTLLPDIAELPFLIETNDISSSFAIADGRGDFDGRYGTSNLTVSLPGMLPGPLEFSSDAMRTQLDLPYAPGPGGDTAEMRLESEALRASEATWALVDPDAHIDRAPGRLLLDLGAAFTPVAPGAAPQVPGLPLALSQFEIRDLLVAFGGATLTGAGALDIGTGADGLPEPVGTVSLALENGLALLDALGQAGIVPQEQMFGIRMMLGVVATRDGTGDRLTSEIGLLPGRSLSLNGVTMPGMP
ncbi:DUF2125 domain-containing protein [Mangrovicoccus algicola]|uniref:DUF2125 domain-containing protein n=1 Tax=Mangrovicoccus algicola TaxID=2771008 RepID=A0A8J7CGG9_9RHOB|nr:DUF2125 domain-containing protein [Mangrovicoccus algicola]MBE3637110.1 DUF2125 domain-containing protein [Mangrovicoccus algicola]